MKKIGIVGGALPEREISNATLGLNESVSYLGIDGDEESWSQFGEYHRAALKRLEASGSAFALMAGRNPHHRLEAPQRLRKIPDRARDIKMESMWERTKNRAATGRKRFRNAEIAALVVSLPAGRGSATPSTRPHIYVAHPPGSQSWQTKSAGPQIVAGRQIFKSSSTLAC